VTTDSNEDPHIDVLQNIEVGLRSLYDRSPTLTDTQCMFALDSAKVAAKQAFGYAKNEPLKILPATEPIVDWCVAVGRERIDKINDLTLKEYLSCIDKIKRSVKRHSASGPRGYYEFIREFV
jgi:hypothetical protein